MEGTLATTDDQVEAIAGQIRAAGSFTLDLEFVPEGRYTPDLALVQVAWGDIEQPEVAAVDPLEVDPRPLVELVGAPEIETIVHAAQADLALLASRFEILGATIHDTQIAAAFVGFGDQIGYAPLVQRVLNVRLHKGSQYTEWLQRPLSSKQLAYALDDVRYLGRIWTELRHRLEQRDRLAWVVEECERLAETAALRPPPEESYRKVKGWARLDPHSQGALRALAAWREHEAIRTNRPPSRVLNDRSLLELARATPARDDGLHVVRGVDAGIVRRHGSALLQAISDGVDSPPDREPARGTLPPRGEVWAATLHGLVRARALGAEVAPRFVGPRSDIEAIVRWWLDGDRTQIPAIPLLHGWRHELVGESLLEWLHGDIALIADPDSEAGIIIEPR